MKCREICKFNIVFRELGGALCAVWSSYITSETKLIFVVDSSDIASIALVSGWLPILMLFKIKL